MSQVPNKQPKQPKPKPKQPKNSYYVNPEWFVDRRQELERKHNTNYVQQISTRGVKRAEDLIFRSRFTEQLVDPDRDEAEVEAEMEMEAEAEPEAGSNE